jgi:hypothetical protein
VHVSLQILSSQKERGDRRPVASSGSGSGLSGDGATTAPRGNASRHAMGRVRIRHQAPRCHLRLRASPPLLKGARPWLCRICKLYEGAGGIRSASPRCRRRMRRRLRWWWRRRRSQRDHQSMHRHRRRWRRSSRRRSGRRR